MADLEEEAVKLKTFSDLTSFYIDYLLVLKDQNVLEDFPDYPYDFPKKLRCNSAATLQALGASKVPIKQEKIIKEEAEPSIKKEKCQTVVKLEKEAMEFVGKSNLQLGGRRSTRFNGYSKLLEEHMELSNDSDTNDDSTEDENTGNNAGEHGTIFNADLDDADDIVVEPTAKSIQGAMEFRIEIERPGKKKTKTGDGKNALAKSSSLSYEKEKKDDGKAAHASSKRWALSKPRNKRFYKYASSSSDETSGVEVSHYKKPSVSSSSNSSEQLKAQAVKIPREHKKMPIKSGNSIKTPNTSTNAQKLGIRRESQMNSLKVAFENTQSFDEAMQVYSNKVQKLKPILPRIIPPPLYDPVRKPKKRGPVPLLKANGNLGGIFTIDNGWDKKMPPREEPVKKPAVVERVDRKITPPELHMQNYDRDLEDNDLINKFCHRSFDGGNQIESDISDSDDGESNLVIDNFETYDNNAALETAEPMPEIPEVLNGENIENGASGVHPKEQCQLACSDEEDEDDDPYNQIYIDSDNLDDLYDEEPTVEISSELDDLKLKVKKIHKINEMHPESQNEFDINTQEIMSNAVDPKTDRILKQFLGNICPAYLENKCTNKTCNRSHQVIDADSFFCNLQQTTHTTVREDIIPVVVRFYKLFLVYVSTLVCKCVLSVDEKALIELVKGCNQHARTKECLRQIAHTGVDLGYWKVHKALQFVIAHHIDSTIARDTIFRMILDAGPYMPYFMDYIEFVHSKQTIADQDFDRILHACVAYQNPSLPNFCLNYLLQCSPERITQFHNDNLKAFLRMNQCVSELNENREAKLISLLDKIKHH